MQSIDRIEDATVEAVRRKQQVWEESLRSSGYAYSKLWADAWCAAFVWKKTREWSHPITEAEFRRIERTPHALHPDWRAEIERLATQYQFFHWHLAFPDVFRVPGPGEQPDNDQIGWIGGFDVVLGNPPWEQTQLEEKEWFAIRRPDIARASTGTARKRMIGALRLEDPALHDEYLDALREADGVSHLVRSSGRYPLTGRGRTNTYALFAESNRMILRSTGRFGCIVPTGIATDATTQYFFRDLTDTGTLASLYGFDNRLKLFPAVGSMITFCLLTLTGPSRPAARGADFVFYAQQPEDLQDDWRHVTLSAADIALLNPNTRTCPIFRSNRDAELTKSIYRRVPVLIEEDSAEKNPWSIGFKQGLFNMTSDSHLFHPRQDLEGEGGRLSGNAFAMPNGERYLPLYEAKMIHQYDHRWATFEAGSTRDMFLDEKSDPAAVAQPQNWVRGKAVDAALGADSTQRWFIATRMMARSTDTRTLIGTIIPRTAVGNSAAVWKLSGDINPGEVVALLGCLSTFIVDFVASQKVGGPNLNFFIVEQFAVLPPSIYSKASIWDSSQSYVSWLLPGMLELIYTAWDLEPFARDCGYDGPPFRWDEERRFLLRCEIDAAYFHLYGIDRDDVDYIMETFPIVKRKDEAAYGEYRTRRVILEIYDELAEAIRSGIPYPTRRDPPPADPRVAHDPFTRPAWLDAEATRSR